VSFLFKAVLVLLAFGFIVYVLKMISRLRVGVTRTFRDVRTLRDEINTAVNSGARAASKVGSTEMVRCAACGSFVASADAVTISSRDKAVFFCSRQCLQSHVKNA
jgi:hypothetical protein